MQDQKILILGDGFNSDLGLKVSYGDFFSSPEWKKLFKAQKNNPLIQWLYEKSIDQSYHIEANIMYYASGLHSVQNACQDKIAFDSLEKAFSDFVNNNLNFNKESKAFQKLTEFQRLRREDKP